MEGPSRIVGLLREDSGHDRPSAGQTMEARGGLAAAAPTCAVDSSSPAISGGGPCLALIPLRPATAASFGQLLQQVMRGGEEEDD